MRYASRAVLLVPLVVALAGCGGQDGPSTSGPASTTPSTATATTGSSASSSSTPTPSSSPAAARPVEDTAPVKAARAFAAAQATDINNRDKSYAASKPLSTTKAQAYLGDFGGEDIDKNEYYPGPLPFTPLALRREASRIRVVTCAWTSGWGQDRASRNPIDPRKIEGLDFVMQRVRGTWKLDDVVGNATTDCSDVSVKGIPF